MRLPITVITRLHCTNHTWDDILAVIKWSLCWAARGLYPSVRHDGSEFDLSKDASRVKLAGRSLDCRAALCEARGDWAFYHEVLHLPSWQNAESICWTCNCTLRQVFVFDANVCLVIPKVIRAPHEKLLTRSIAFYCRAISKKNKQTLASFEGSSSWVGCRVADK